MRNVVVASISGFSAKGLGGLQGQQCQADDSQHKGVGGSTRIPRGFEGDDEELRA